MGMQLSRFRDYEPILYFFLRLYVSPYSCLYVSLNLIHFRSLCCVIPICEGLPISHPDGVKKSAQHSYATQKGLTRFPSHKHEGPQNLSKLQWCLWVIWNLWEANETWKAWRASQRNSKRNRILEGTWAFSFEKQQAGNFTTQLAQELAPLTPNNTAPTKTWLQQTWNLIETWKFIISVIKRVKKGLN